MTHDPMDKLVQDALHRDVAEALPRLEGFEDRVVKAIGDRLPRLGLAGWLRQLLAPTRTARWGQIGVVAATAAAFLFLGVALGGRFPFIGDHPTTLAGTNLRAQATDNDVLFVLPALDAENVAVVGSFNSWEPTPLSDDDGDGIWTASLPLPPGRYEYAFVIDGRWWGQDPLADEYVRSFGEYSSVRYVVGGGDGA